jgi:Zn-dependent peptidase ImmA (M78 family)
MDTASATYCINPTLLKWARESIGYSVDQAAKRLNVGVDELVKWENGEIETPIKKIRKLSETYKRATTVFLLDSIPDENISTSFRKLLYSNIKLFTPETIIAVRKAVRIQTLAKDVLDFSNNDFLVKAKNLTANNRVETISDNVVGLLNVDEKSLTSNRNPYEQLNMWKAALESKGIYVLELGFPKEEALGFAIYDQKAPVIVLNTNDYPRSRIFTLLHELGHFIFNGDAIDNSSTILNFTSADSLEIKCNLFAGSCLIPKKYIEDKIHLLGLDPASDLETCVSTLVSVFNVSSQVVLRRLYSLSYIEKTQFVAFSRVLKEDFSKLPDQKKATGGNFYVKFAKNNSKTFIYDILDAYRLKRISHFDVLDFLSIKNSTLTKLESRL